MAEKVNYERQAIDNAWRLITGTPSQVMQDRIAWKRFADAWKAIGIAGHIMAGGQFVRRLLHAVALNKQLADDFFDTVEQMAHLLATDAECRGVHVGD